MTSTARVVRWTAPIAALAAIALASAMVLRTSSAAFTDTADNASNSWEAGTVTLSDDDGGSALFSASGLVPSDTSTNCIEVTYGGSVTLSSAVDLYASVTETTVGGDGLGNDLDVVVEMGDAATSCSLIGVPTEIYNGTLAAFDTSASPLDTWTPSGTDTMRPFQFTVTLGDDTPDSAQGEGADATFTWSATG